MKDALKNKDQLYIPEARRTADWKARIGVALVAGGGAVCGLLVALGEGINFIRGCANESVLRAAMGFQQADLVTCLKETPRMLDALLK